MFDLGSIIAKIKADSTEFNRGLNEAKGELNSFKNKIGNVGDNIADFGKKAAIMTGVVTTAVGAGITLIGKSALKSAAEFEQAEIAYTTLLGSTKAAREALKGVREDAAKTPFNLPELIKANQLLLGAGATADESRQAIKDLGNAIAATGGGTAELGRMAQNLQQIRNVGTASAMDIKQFAFAGINVYKLLADSMGKTVAEVKDSTITYEDLTTALHAASLEGGMYAGAMENQSRSLNGMISNLQDSVGLTLTSIATNSGFLDVVKAVTGGLINLVETVGPKIERFFAVFGNVISSTVGILRGENLHAELVEALGFFTGEDSETAKVKAEELANKIVNFGEKIKELGNWIKENKEMLIDALKALAIAFGALLVIGTIAAVIATLTNPLVLVAGLIAALAFAWQSNLGGMRDKTEEIVTKIKGFFDEYLKPAIEAVRQWFVDNWDAIKVSLETTWAVIKFIIQTAWNLISGIIKVGLAVLSGDWGKAWEAIKETFSKEWDAIKGLFNQIVEFIKTWGGKILNHLTQPFRDAWDEISKLADKIKEKIDVINPFHKESPSLVENVQKGVGMIKDYYGSLADIRLPGVSAGTSGGLDIANQAVPAGAPISININMAGANIASPQIAGDYGEAIGDAIIERLRIARRGYV